jgi:hypothetical protein
VTLPLAAAVLAAPQTAAEAGALFAGAEVIVLDRGALRPARPFDGPLFEVLSGLSAAGIIGLVVPVRPVRGGASHGGGTGQAGEAAGAGAADAHGEEEAGLPAAGSLVAVEDHVGLEARGPLTGRWPEHVPRDFPAMTGRYQPAVVRSAGGPRVYSGGVVAGVGDLARLTPFEIAALRSAGCLAAADLLVPPAVVAAYYGHSLAACGVVQGPPVDEE